MSKTILYVYSNYSSFVEKDKLIMSADYSLRCFEFKPLKKSETPWFFLKQLAFIFKNYNKNCLFVVQFSGYHAFLPCLIAKITRKPSLIIAGGTDCVAFPSINYGNLRKNLLGKFTSWSYQLASHISPVDASLIFCDYFYQKSDGNKQGIKAHIANLKTPITVIFNGYDGRFFRMQNVPKEKNLFITVASGIESRSRFELKGVDMFFYLANTFPEHQFLLIGADKVPDSIPSNLTLLPFVKNEDLITYYNKATFYVQLSLSEGFPNSLCEAMLCECIPIVSSVGAMPNIIEDSGFILSEKNTEDLKKLIEIALNSDTKSLGLKAAGLVSKKYPLVKRQQELLNLLNQLHNK